MKEIFMVLMLVAFGGCITGEKAPDAGVPLDMTYELESLGGENVLPGTSVTLRFGPDNRATGSGGCNNYFSSYEIGEGGAISFGLIGSTMMYCEGAMDQEQEYFRALENASIFAVDKNGLQLFYDGGQKVLNFALVES